MEYKYIRFEGGPYNNLTMAVEEPLPRIYPVPILRNLTRYYGYLDDPPMFQEFGHAKYELQLEYDLVTGKACGAIYKLIDAPGWYYEQQIGSAR